MTTLMNNSSSFNVLKKGYCCKHGLVIQPFKKELTNFNGSINFVVGLVEVLVAIEKWKAILPFYVLDHGTHLIIRYPSLKTLKLSANCVLDCLVGEDVDRILCKVVKVAKNHVDREKLEVHQERQFV